MSASADHDGYIVCTNNGSCTGGVQNGGIYGGTSVSTPVFAGIVTLLNQQMKNTPPAGLGNINTTLYQFAQSVPAAFHDVPTGNYNILARRQPERQRGSLRAGHDKLPGQSSFKVRIPDWHWLRPGNRPGVRGRSCFCNQLGVCCQNTDHHDRDFVPGISQRRSHRASNGKGYGNPRDRNRYSDGIGELLCGRQ